MSNLFEQASLIVTPNAFKASKLYSIKPTDGSGDLSVVRATTATDVNSAGLIESVAVNVPRLDYTNSTCPSILVEPQRTNLFLNSNSFTGIYQGGDVITSSEASPLKSINYLKFSENTGTAQHHFESIITALANTTYTMSIFAKKSERDILILRAANSVFSNIYVTATFNLTTGVATNGIMIPYQNGYKCIATFTTLTDIILRVRYNINTAGNYNGISGYGLYVTGAQLEAGSNATSYIPTLASTVTRNADVISKTGISSLIGQTEGTIFAQIRVSRLLGTASRYIFHLSDGTTNNRIYMAFSGASSNILRARIFNGGVLQASIESSTITNLGTYKLALAYKNNDIVFYINGVQIGTDASATIPTCSRVDLGQNFANASQFNDGISNANIWKTRLTNAELAQLTTL
jgi:hypothetical protein